MAKDKLTAARVKALKEPGRYADGAGLYLFIDKNGNKRWIYRFTLDGRTSERGLGSAEVYSLADARDRAAEERRLHKAGVNPVSEAKAAKEERKNAIPTFGEVADDFVKVKVKEFKNEKHIWQWKQTLTNHCQAIRGKPVNEIRVADVMAVLEPIWTETPETATRLRGRIEMVLDAARVRGFIDETAANPARWKGNLALLLPARRAIDRGSHLALPYAKLPAFFAKLKKSESISALALQFTILTAARTGEVIGATWAEIDMKNQVWIVPAIRMKKGREHRVPLSDAAMEILGRMKETRVSAIIFPGHGGEAMSNMTMDAVLRRMNMKDVATVHGFRSTFRDWAGDETDYPKDIAEMALAHLVGSDVERAYRRGDALDKRRQLMNDWAAFCTSKVGDRS